MQALFKMIKHKVPVAQNIECTIQQSIYQHDRNKTHHHAK